MADVDMGGVVVLATLEDIFMGAGATTFDAVWLNGVNRNVQLAAREIAVPADGTTLTATMTWKPV